MYGIVVVPNDLNQKKKKRNEDSFTLSLLEAGEIPIEELSVIARREGKRPRQIYQTHKWFARRFGSAFRALLVAASVSHETEFWDAYYDSGLLDGLTVMDPFVGGGTSLIEAQRLGASCIGIDVDPVAVAITKFQSKISELPDLSDILFEVKKEIGQIIRPYHITETDDGKKYEVLHHFWVQVVECKECENEIEAHPHYQLAHNKEQDTQYVFCKECGEIDVVSLSEDDFVCSHCCTKTDINIGNVKRGKLVCPLCQSSSSLVDIAKETNSPPKWMLFAQEVLSLSDNRKKIPIKDRKFKRATKKDIEAYNKANEMLEEVLKDKNCKARLPNRLIPSCNRTDNRIIQYGYKYYDELFNKRQLLHLVLLANKIKSLSNLEREALSIAFSDHLKTNCMMTHYAFGWRRLAPLFSIRAFRHIVRPVEINPWLEGTGRGTYPNSVRSIIRAAEWLEAPQEAVASGGFKEVKHKENVTKAKFTVSNKSSSDLDSIDNNSVDIVLTDPPYFDNIAYSELSDFFVPWMHEIGLIDTDNDGGFPKGQLAASKRNHDSLVEFGERLGDCFCSVSKKLKKNGRIIFTYQHRTTFGWLALAEALSRTDFVVTKIFPMLGDAQSGLHKHSESISWDAVIVAKRGKVDVGDRRLHVTDRSYNNAKQAFKYWVARLEALPEGVFSMPDQENLARALLMGASLDMKTKKEEKDSIELVSLLDDAISSLGGMDATD